MKTLPFFLISCTLLLGKTFVLEEKNIKFLKVTQKQQEKQTRNGLKNSSKPCYYKYELISKETCYKTTGNIFVTFGKNTQQDYLKYAKKHHLIFIREINTLYHTIVYEIKDKNIEVINFVNALNKIKKEEKITVEWIQPRFLR